MLLLSGEGKNVKKTLLRSRRLPVIPDPLDNEVGASYEYEYIDNSNEFQVDR